MGCRVRDGYVLVVAEKPKAAARIAEALSDGSTVRCRHRSGAPYWVLRFDGRLFVVGSAAGHLFGLHTSRRGFPVFEYEWRPLWEVDRGAGYVKPFYNALRDLSRGAILYVNACDYDIEGSVIGYMVIRFFGDLGRARRARFSSLTPGELRTAFARLTPLDFEMVEAGLARHELDWIWGVNISRALMDAVRRVSGRRVVLSAGRVQSPTLIEAVNRDLEARLHLPLPVYSVRVTFRRGSWSGSVTVATYDKRASAVAHAERLRAGRAVVEGVEGTKRLLPPPYPFNLGDLQAEAARVYGYSPYYTQQVAEDLYLEGLISYPRTNSQRLPETLELDPILRGLLRHRAYRELIERLYRLRPRPRPRNGPKDDPAHPAIHPTGELPRRPLKQAEDRIYDLIVRRFLASMYPSAVLTIRTVIILLPDGSRTRLRSETVAERGWLEVYGKFLSIGGGELPDLNKGDVVDMRVRVARSFTRAPSRYSKASLVRWMEAKGIGTEATRARIVELLFRRGYLEGSRHVKATDLGIAVAKVLARYFPDIASVELTRRFEELLDDIMHGRRSRGEVVAEARRLLASRLGRFRDEELEVVGRYLAEWIGAVNPASTCRVCGRPAASDGLCELHREAVERLRRGFDEWRTRGEGVRWPEFLEKIASMRSAGSLVREAAKHMFGSASGYHG